MKNIHAPFPLIRVKYITSTYLQPPEKYNCFLSADAETIRTYSMIEKVGG